MSKPKATRQPAAYYRLPENSIGYLSRVMFRSFSRALERRTLEHGVSAGQWRFLRQLWLEDGITQRELSARVGMREPTTVVALKSLEAAGLVRREKCKIDRRKIYIHLTDHAKALADVLVPMNAEVHDLATAGLSDAEVDALQSLLRRVIANLAEEAKDAPTLSDVRA